MHLFTSHLCDIMPYLPSCPRHQVEDTVTVRPYFFPPKTPPRYFHHQKVLCDDANIYSCIALKIINTPVNRSSSLHQLWVSTGPKWEAPSQYHDWGLCHLGAVETIMVGSNLTILDQIAKFLLLLSDAPSYWFTLNTSCDHAFHLSKWLGMEHNDYKALLVAANLVRYKGGEFMIMLDKWKSFCAPCHPHPCPLRRPPALSPLPSCQSPASLIAIALAANVITLFIALHPRRQCHHPLHPSRSLHHPPPLSPSPLSCRPHPF